MERETDSPAPNQSPSSPPRRSTPQSTPGSIPRPTPSPSNRPGSSPFGCKVFRVSTVTPPSRLNFEGFTPSSPEPGPAPKCTVCNAACSEQCSECLQPLHADCGRAGKCTLCARAASIAGERSAASSSLKKQAEKMLKTSRQRFPPAAVGDTVIIPVPDVDRGRGDPRNVICVVVEVTEDNLYRLGNKQGRLNTLLARSMFTVRKEKFISVEDVPDTYMALRSMATAQSLSGGQGYVRCACKTGCKPSSKCKCRGAGVLCNSKCHGSSTCSNK
ncbi:SCAN domain-containing protein 3 [Frankliniella fusca]|uniref:SCAN domain-containing protein 3 n=1 Tax=Frankliniella fusca TaxID=407009 RepID=A0AAE1LJR7_9NEOP|nr:SCAN domain-containing protein 3 [Frankliniella fusca]